MPYSPYQTFNYGGPGTTLSALRTMTPDQLLAMRTNARIAQAAPALAENARQFDVGTAEGARQFNLSDLFRNKQLGEEGRQFDVTDVFRNKQLTSEEERALAQLGENARQFDIGTGLSYAQLSARTLTDQLNAWANMMAGLR